MLKKETESGLIALSLIFDKTTSGHILLDDFFVGDCLDWDK